MGPKFKVKEGSLKIKHQGNISRKIGQIVIKL